MTVTVYAPLGMLGYGFPIHSLEAAMKHGFDVIALDAGSVDPGPYYLGSGKSFTSRTMVKRDLELILKTARTQKVPLLIGTAGGSGGRPHVDWLMDIFTEIVKEQGLSVKVARIEAEQEASRVINSLREGRIDNFEAGYSLTPELVRKSERIVAQMGIHPFMEALEAGAEVIIAGRAYDAAVIAAYPIWKGEDPGLSYHMGKILECGSLVALPRESDGMIGIINNGAFRVSPADPHKRCFPDTVAAHTLYERSTPFFHAFPGGELDLSACIFTAIDERTVEIKGSKYKDSAENFLKIEGAAFVGYRNLCIAGIRDPQAIKGFAEIEDKVRSKIVNNLPQYKTPQDYRLCFHKYGMGEVMGSHEPMTLNPQEIGLVIEVVSPEQSIADTVGALARSAILHMGFAGRKANSGNLAFLFTPAEFAGPPCYEFNIYHLMQVDSLLEPFPITYLEVGK